MSDVPGGPMPPPLPPPPPPPMMGGPQGSIPPKTLGEILSAAFSIYRANASKLLLIVAIIVVPLSFLNTLSGLVFAGTTRTEDVFGMRIEVTERSFGLLLVGAFVTLAISLVISAVLQAAILRAAARATIGDPVDPEESFRFGFKRLGSVILVSVLVGLVVAGGFILLVVPGIIFFVFLSVSIPVLIVENRRGTAAMSRSWNLVKGHAWHAFGVLLVVAIIAGVIMVAVGAIGDGAWVVRWIFAAIGQILTAPFTALASVLLYLDLRSRSEAISADTLRAELAAAGSAR